MLVEADGDFDVLLRRLGRTCDWCQLRGQRLGVDCRLFRHFQSQFVRVNEREGREMRRRKFEVLLAADGQDFACQLFDLAVVCDVNRCDFLVEQFGNDFRNHFDLALVEVRDDLVAGFDRQLEQMTVCACSLLRSSLLSKPLLR